MLNDVLLPLTDGLTGRRLYAVTRELVSIEYPDDDVPEFHAVLRYESDHEVYVRETPEEVVAVWERVTAAEQAGRDAHAKAQVLRYESDHGVTLRV